MGDLAVGKFGRIGCGRDRRRFDVNISLDNKKTIRVGVVERGSLSFLGRLDKPRKRCLAACQRVRRVLQHPSSRVDSRTHTNLATRAPQRGRVASSPQALAAEAI